MLLFYCLFKLESELLWNNPGMREFVPGSVAGWSRRSILWYSMLLRSSITSCRIIESLFRRLVLILEIRDRSVLPHHFCCMQLEVLGGIIHGTHDVLLHEIDIDDSIKPYSLPLFSVDAHHFLTMDDEIWPDVIVEKQSCGQSHWMSRFLIEIKSWYFLHCFLVYGLDDSIVWIIILCHIVE